MLEVKFKFVFCWWARRNPLLFSDDRECKRPNLIHGIVVVEFIDGFCVGGLLFMYGLGTATCLYDNLLIFRS